jgi:hypothetical protein
MTPDLLISLCAELDELIAKCQAIGDQIVGKKDADLNIYRAAALLLELRDFNADLDDIAEGLYVPPESDQDGDLAEALKSFAQARASAAERN